jgi:hypothetical protein
MTSPITFGPGITLGAGVSVGPTTGGGGGSGGSISFIEMTGGGDHNQWLEDPTATMITNGFVLNAVSGGGQATNGVAINYLTNDNKTFFSTYGTGSKTATWAAGSTYTSPMTINIVTNDPNGTPELVFFMNDVISFPATFKFPVTFS